MYVQYVHSIASTYVQYSTYVVDDFPIEGLWQTTYLPVESCPFPL